MADQADDLDDDLDAEIDDLNGDDADLDGPPGRGGKKKLLIIVGAFVVLLAGGGAAAFFTGLLQPVIDAVMGAPPETEATAEEAAPVILGDAVFYDLEDMLVNLNTGSRKSTFFKIRISLELESERDIEEIQKVMPRIIDNFQVYLRELRIEDLKGSAGMYRLREELLIRVNAATAPIKVNDVLFKEMLLE